MQSSVEENEARHHPTNEGNEGAMYICTKEHVSYGGWLGEVGLGWWLERRKMNNFSFFS